jgi:hypothetical protein
MNIYLLCDVSYVSYCKYFPNGGDGKGSYMNGYAVFSDRNKPRSGIPAIGAACTVNLVLSTIVCYKTLNVDTAKGLKTSGQVIIKEVQPTCNGRDAHT